MRSIKELSAEANAYPFSPGISFPSWIHVCQTLQREARVYDLENDPKGIERAYILYLRMADLVLNRLPRHPNFAAYKSQYARVYNQIPGAIERSETLKKRLEARKREPAAKSTTPSAKDPKQTDEALSSIALEQSLLANDSGISDPDHFDTAQISLDDSLRSTLKSLKTPHRAASGAPTPQPRIPAAYEYPSIPAAAPKVAPQPAAQLSSPATPGGMRSSTPAARPVAENTAAQHKSVYTTEKGEQLRPLYVPADLRRRFLEMATKNTRAGLETCGILCGKLNRNAFFVTNLVVPHQTSTSDSCDMTNEEELFEYVDKRDLFIVGWIHTHPTQSCFMSSIDLHTQVGYQIMLPEAIAIVCAPSSDPSWGVFRLTDPPGVDVIKTCRQTGFHPHPQPNLYTLATPGHVKEIPFSFEDADLRDA